MKVTWGTIIIYLLITALMSGVNAEEALISPWEVSVNFIPPDQENLDIFFNLNNDGSVGITGVEFVLTTDGLSHVETPEMSFGGDEESEKLSVTTRNENGKGIITVMFPSVIETGDSRQGILKFSSRGLLRSDGDEFTTLVSFQQPRVILENGEKRVINTKSGNFRIHTPEGFVYTRSNPEPWREIWQGVSGFKAHYILVFNGGTSLTTPITVSFKGSNLVQRAADLYGGVLAAEAGDQIPRERLERANRHITEAANYIIQGNEDLGKIELDAAEAILNGGSPPVSDSDDTIRGPYLGGETSYGMLYIMALGFAALFVLILIFGRKIIDLMGENKNGE